jgi:hypothetical protein
MDAVVIFKRGRYREREREKKTKLRSYPSPILRRLLFNFQIRGAAVINRRKAFGNKNTQSWVGGRRVRRITRRKRVKVKYKKKTRECWWVMMVLSSF